MKVYDISYLLNESTPIYPGNANFSIKRVQNMPKDSSNSSAITMGSHFATHIDAPVHVIEDGKGIDKFPIDRFVGKCDVLDFSMLDTESIDKKDLEKKNIKNNIVLIKTKNSIRGFDIFHEDFIYLSDSGSDYLLSKGVKLVGIDGPSIKKFRYHPDYVHNNLLGNDCLIAEGLNLLEVLQGEYFFLGAPLNFEGSDASPARIILIEDFYE